MFKVTEYIAKLLRDTLSIPVYIDFIPNSGELPISGILLGSIEDEELTSCYRIVKRAYDFVLFTDKARNISQTQTLLDTMRERLEDVSNVRIDNSIKICNIKPNSNFDGQSMQQELVYKVKLVVEYEEHNETELYIT